MGGLRRILHALLGRSVEVPLAACVHFGGWRYGRTGFNPYEDYCAGLTARRPKPELKAAFTDFLCHYRPHDFGGALGVKLSQPHALWDYPWARRTAPPAWRLQPEDCPDILTHFSEAGVQTGRIEEEFRWLESTYHSILERGYAPAAHAGWPHARRLRAENGAERFIILDGNHRIAALGALNVTKVVVRCWSLQDVREAALARWPGVRRGAWSREDARAIFHAYFPGNQHPRTTEMPAPLIGTVTSDGDE
jgi:hypothetical protein